MRSPATSSSALLFGRVLQDFSQLRKRMVSFLPKAREKNEFYLFKEQFCVILKEIKSVLFPS